MRCLFWLTASLSVAAQPHCTPTHFEWVASSHRPRLETAESLRILLRADGLCGTEWPARQLATSLQGQDHIRTAHVRDEVARIFDWGKRKPFSALALVGFNPLNAASRVTARIPAASASP